MTNTTDNNEEKVKRSHDKNSNNSRSSSKGEKRPKKMKLEDKLGLSDNKTKQQQKQRQQGIKPKTNFPKSNSNYERNNINNINSSHRFGKVMIDTPKRSKPRSYTLSIAVPGSFVSNAVTLELSTYLVGQIARASVIYNVDEIIVYNDNLSNSKKLPFRRRREKPSENNNTSDNKPSTPEIFLRKLLEYCECPQYLRKDFFPFHPDFQFVGMLPPLDPPHHVREWDTHCRFREGVVLDRTATTSGMSLVNVGLKKYIEIDRKLVGGIRVTVEIIDHLNSRGKVVSPSRPNEIDGTYWGYTTRLADSIQKVFDQCPYNKNGYDVKIGTSERGNKSIDDDNFTLPTQKIIANNIKQHILIVFGGVAGIEECIDADESLKISGEDTHKMFDCWLNACPLQGSRTIRTEEAVLLTLARLNPIIEKYSSNTITSSEEKIVTAIKPTEFSDASVSEESSDGE